MVEVRVTGGGETGSRCEVRVRLFPKPENQLDQLTEVAQRDDVAHR